MLFIMRQDVLCFFSYCCAVFFKDLDGLTLQQYSVLMQFYRV